MDEQERFTVAVHKMRDAFQVLKEDAPWGAYDAENGSFYDGYREAKRLFGDMLRQRGAWRKFGDAIRDFSDGVIR